MSKYAEIKKKRNFLFTKDLFKYLKTTHSYHLVDPSPWPFVASLGAFMITSGLVLYMHKFVGGWNLFLSGFLITFYVMYTWWRDVIREATLEEHHSVLVQKGLRLGMILFIVSEVMFFFAFFWAFFHSSIAPVYNLGGVWPPKAITPMDTYTIPLTNTFFLLTSGATVTWAHHALVARAKKQTLLALVFTLILAILFTSLQGLEYVEASFNISDGVYGSCFYMATGFHGFHVFVGTIALLVSFVRIVFNHFTDHHHFGFESAIWYWHFVDVVWLFLFLGVYWWGNSILVIETRSLYSLAPRLTNTALTFYPVIKILLLGDSIFVFLANLFFSIFIIFKYTSDKFLQDFFKFWLSLPILNKWALLFFTVTVAVPNKIWINNRINLWVLVFFFILLLSVGFWFNFLGLIAFINYFLFIAVSYLFAVFYEKMPVFKNWINTNLFNGDLAFAQIYFSFFWGNMQQASKVFAKAVGLATPIVIGAEIRANQEQEAATKFANSEAAQAVALTKEGFKTVKELDDFKRAKNDYYIENKTVISKAIKKAGRVFLNLDHL